MTKNLFQYIDSTIIQLNNNLIPKKETLQFLKVLEKDLFINNTKLEYLELLKVETFPYWKNLLFTSSKDIIDSLFFISQSNLHTFKPFVFEYLVDEFLKLDEKLKLDFYSNNLSIIRINKTLTKNIVCFNNKFLNYFKEDNTIHNLHTMYLIHNSIFSDLNKFELICKDMKNILNLNENQFLDKFGVGIIALLPLNLIKENVNKYQIMERTEFQEAIATKFFNRGFSSKEFLYFVKKNILPYDVKLPTENIYLYNHVIDNYITGISYQWKVLPFSQDKFISFIIESNLKINELFKKNNLYFSKLDLFKKSLNTLEDQLNYSKNKEINIEILNFILNFKNKFLLIEKNKITNKTKI